MDHGRFRVKDSHFQNKATCKIIVVKKSHFICMRIKSHFQINSFAISLALKQRLGGSQKAW